MNRTLGVLLVAAAIAGCAEDLTVTGVCPNFCPPGEVRVRDTILGDLVRGDSAFRGYVKAHEAAVMPVATLPGELESRAIFATSQIALRIRLGADTATGAVVGIDSLRLALAVVRRDTTARQLSLAFHRLPRTIDTTTTFADLAAEFAAPPIRVVNLDSLVALPGRRDTVTQDSVVVDSLSGVVTLFTFFDSAQVAFAEEDSGRLGIGIRVRADSVTGSGRASVAIGAGANGPVLTWFVQLDSLGLDTIPRTLGAGAVFDSYVADPPPPALDSTLAVGAAPSARSLLRFERPQALFDSSQVVRATLVLVPLTAPVGTAADSFRVFAQRIVTDLGGKSPLVGPLFPGDVSFFGAATVRPGVLDTVRIDVTDIVRRWQVDTAAPTAVMLRADPEGGTLSEIRFGPSRLAGARPALQITYVPFFPFGAP